MSSDDWGGRTTRVEINLDAVAANVQALKRHVTPARFMAVLKANAYGHGAPCVAQAAVDGGADWLGVYTPDEGFALRAAGIAAPILVFGPFHPAEVSRSIAQRLTPTVTCREDVLALQEVNGQIRCHVKVDTGMHRAGVAAAEAVDLIRHIAGIPGLEVEGIFTHFARSDEVDKGPTRRQFAVFNEVIQTLASAGIRPELRHVANSGALLDLPETHLEMVRSGICVYGYYPSDEVSRSVQLQPALQFVSAIRRLHWLAPGEGVGYGHEFVAERPTLIGLVPVGYGDGVPRTLGHGTGRVLVRGKSVPIVGRVSMDQITLDVTSVPGAAVGDRVTLIGRNGAAEQSAEDVAARAGTISYDILTRILPRVPRLYSRAGELVS